LVGCTDPEFHSHFDKTQSTLYTSWPEDPVAEAPDQLHQLAALSESPCPLLSQLQSLLQHQPQTPLPQHQLLRHLPLPSNNLPEEVLSWVLWPLPLLKDSPSVLDHHLHIVLLIPLWVLEEVIPTLMALSISLRLCLPPPLLLQPIAHLT
jgi:hypothetical protein